MVVTSESTLHDVYIERDVYIESTLQVQSELTELGAAMPQLLSRQNEVGPFVLCHLSLCHSRSRPLDLDPFRRD